MAKCGACGRFSSAQDGVKCNKCELFFHRACVKISLDAKVASTWYCPGCKAATPRKDNTERPVRGENDDFSCLVTPSDDKTDELLRQMKLMNQEMRSFRGDFNEMREELTTLRTDVSGFAGRMDVMEERLASMERHFSILQSKPDTVELLETIDRLKYELNERDQEALLNDLEITGIPEEQGENVGHILSLISEKLSISCGERDIVSVERAGLRRARATSSEEEVVPRPRAIVVRLATRRLRDDFLKSARVRSRINTEGLALKSAPTRFYVNERLTKTNKALFYKVREESRRHGWRYAWTKGGRIYVRRESGKTAFRVRSDTDIPKIFGSDSVGSRLSQD